MANGAAATVTANHGSCARNNCDEPPIAERTTMSNAEFYDGIAKELFGRLGRLGTFTKHAPSVGRYHEELIKSCISTFLSSRFSLRTGFAYLEDGKVSSQGDLLIVDENDPSPYFFRQGDFVVVHPRSVACVIEVKTTLNKSNFLDAIKNLHSFKQISTDRNFPVTLIFAFDGTRMGLQTLDKWYRAVTVSDEIANYPHVIFCLNQGTLILRPSNESRPHGHYFVCGENVEQWRLKGLSLFLQTVRKSVERKSWLDTNPFEYAVLGGLRWSQQGLRFGIGYGTDAGA